MIREEGFFDSANGRDKIKYYIRRPEGNPRAVIQIVHGMNEYFGRYEELCSYLCAEGFVVCGHDQLGHGASVSCDEDLGFFADGNGDVALVSDVGTLHGIMKKKYRFLPYVLLGHSFGSFVSRAYAATHHGAIDGLVLSGTSGQKMPVGAGKLLCKLVAAFKGWRYRSQLVANIAFSGYNKQFGNKGSTGKEWVTSDPEALRAYVNDKYCNFLFTLRGFFDMFSIIDYIQSDKWYDDMPKGLPVFLMSGELDPVSNNTKGLFELMEKLKDRDMCNIEFVIYKGEHHEPFTGLCKNEAFKDLSDWTEERIQGVIEARMQGYAQSGAYTQPGQ